MSAKIAGIILYDVYGTMHYMHNLFAFASVLNTGWDKVWMHLSLSPGKRICFFSRYMSNETFMCRWHKCWYHETALKNSSLCIILWEMGCWKMIKRKHFMNELRHFDVAFRKYPKRYNTRDKDAKSVFMLQQPPAFFRLSDWHMLLTNIWIKDDAIPS